MNDYSTTQVPDSPVARCPSNCKEAMDMVMEDVNRITRNGPAIDRNVAITDAYQQLGKDMPNNHWVRLAGYVSVQGGCAMKQVRTASTVALAGIGFPAGRGFGNKLAGAQDALRDANTTIFTSVYPPNKFMRECGYERLKQCSETEGWNIDPALIEGLRELNRGNLAKAADLIAEHEQVDVVQPVYERHRDDFEFLQSLDRTKFWSDDTSIPVSYECTRDDLVPLGELEIQKPRDRVIYYRKLMDRMKDIEGLK